jgi:hypothetical protein
MMDSLRSWLKVSLFNLLIVAAIGVVLRYKILYSLPFIDQKNLLHGHSHFAFSGWITQALMALLVYSLSSHTGKNFFKKYRIALYANLLCAYGMLVTFPSQGYGLYSIIFSNLSILCSWYFAILFWRDLNKSGYKNGVASWFKAALVFNVISSFGAFALAFMMATKHLHQSWYLASVYFFLHFQYNGWFFFACMGLLIEKLFVSDIHSKALKGIFRIFAIACVPAYFLSALWLPIPLWIYIIVCIVAIAQVVGWMWMVQLMRKNKKPGNLPNTAWSKLLWLPALALTIKLLLQAGSTIPSLSDLAFGFRPIVIGYLHLVLLGMITLFILGYMVCCSLITINKRTIKSLIIFSSGVILNEMLLMIQGVAGMSYTAVPFIDQGLLLAALILFMGMLLLNYSQYNSKFRHV